MSRSGRAGANVPAGIKMGCAWVVTLKNSASNPKRSIQATFTKSPVAVFTGSFLRNASNGRGPNDVSTRDFPPNPGVFHSKIWRVLRRARTGRLTGPAWAFTFERISSSDNTLFTVNSLTIRTFLSLRSQSGRRLPGQIYTPAGDLLDHYTVPSVVSGGYRCRSRFSLATP